MGQEHNLIFNYFFCEETYILHTLKWRIEEVFLASRTAESNGMSFLQKKKTKHKKTQKLQAIEICRSRYVFC